MIQPRPQTFALHEAQGSSCFGYDVSFVLVPWLRAKCIERVGTCRRSRPPQQLLKCHGLGFRDSGLGIRVYGSGFRDWGLGFRV